MSGSEKRAHVRERVRYDARVEVAGGGSFEGVVENLGALGALVATAEIEVPLEPGDRVILHVFRADGDLGVSGEILRIDQELSGGEIRRALAVKFDTPLDS